MEEFENSLNHASGTYAQALLVAQMKGDVNVPWYWGEVSAATEHRVVVVANLSNSRVSEANQASNDNMVNHLPRILQNWC